MNIDVIMARMTVLSMSNRSATCPEAGAIIDEETGLMNVNADTINTALHFLLKLQLHARNHSGRTREVMLSILSWIFWVIWTIPIDGEGVIITGTIRR
jgi:hypothetical protein